MRKRCLDFVCCPECSGRLEIISDETAEFIEKGFLRCQGCARVYPITDGIPRLLPIAQTGEWSDETRDAFSREWLNYPGALPEDERTLLEEAQLDYKAWKGKQVLDAGCGMGRYTMVALSLGAEVIALDFSESVRRMEQLHRENHKLHVVQGNLLRAPLKNEIFDIVCCHGVLHHTAEPYTACRNLAKTVKKQGRLSIWVYGKPGGWDDFRTNPLRANRQWLASVRFPLWLLVWLRHICSEAIRAVTTRLPSKIAYLLAMPLAALGAFPLLKYLTFSVHPSYRVRLAQNFEWISPRYQSHHTKEELTRWYEEAGFQIEKILPHGVLPKPGILAKKI